MDFTVLLKYYDANAPTILCTHRRTNTMVPHHFYIHMLYLLFNFQGKTYTKNDCKNHAIIENDEEFPI